MASKSLNRISTAVKSQAWNIWKKRICWISSSIRMNQHLTVDPTQALLLREPCIAVDTNDQPLKSISKEEAHLLGPYGELPPLHRAFSVFLFNTKNELLMQQRSNHKITFPGKWIIIIWLSIFLMNDSLTP